MDAAVLLFNSKGFEATTVEEIADAVEVSSRTFFRYFASKDDVIASIQGTQFAELHDEFERRPSDEPVMTAIRHACSTVLRRHDGANSLDSARFTCVAQLAQESPAAFAHGLELCGEHTERFNEQIAARMGVDPRTDLRPQLVSAATMAAMQLAVRVWSENQSATTVSELADRALALLEAGINYPAARA